MELFYELLLFTATPLTSSAFTTVDSEMFTKYSLHFRQPLAWRGASPNALIFSELTQQCVFWRGGQQTKLQSRFHTFYSGGVTANRWAFLLPAWSNQAFIDPMHLRPLDSPLYKASPSENISLPPKSLGTVSCLVSVAVNLFLVYPLWTSADCGSKGPGNKVNTIFVCR